MTSLAVELSEDDKDARKSSVERSLNPNYVRDPCNSSLYRPFDHVFLKDGENVGAELRRLFQ